MSKFNSVEYYLILQKLKSINGMEIHIASKIEDYIYELVITPNKKYRTKYGNFDGEYIEWYPSKKKKYHYNYINGLLYGKQLKYYDNESNQLMNEIMYNNNLKDGEHFEWFINGSLSIHYIFKKGKLHDKQHEYYDNQSNQLKSVITYLYGLKHGEYNEWYKLSYYGDINNFDPILKCKINYVFNKKQGKYKEWSNSGNKIIESNYLNGLLHGYLYNYYQNFNNSLHYKQEYKLGKMHGMRHEFLSNKKKYIVSHYEDGFLNGLYTKFFDDKKILEVFFVNGKINGILTEWFRKNTNQLYRTYSISDNNNLLLNYKEYDINGNIIIDEPVKKKELKDIVFLI